MRSLFICVTQFQVLSALSLAKELRDDNCYLDLILVPPIAHNERWLNWLNKIGCFDRIYTLKSARACSDRLVNFVCPCKYSGTCFSYMDFLTCFGNHGKLVEKTLRKSLLVKTDTLVNISEYDRVIFGSPDVLTESLICGIKKANPNVELYGLDEGLGSYLPSAFSKYPELKRVYLFEPELARVEFPVFPLGKLDRPEMLSIWDEMNKAFGDVLPEIHPGMLFFDQWLDMPWTQDLHPQDWKSRPYIRYKDHLLDELRTVFTKRTKSLTYIPHPLQTSEATEHYRTQGFEVLKSECPFPFEFNWFNPKNKAALESHDPFWCLTVYSSAVVMPFITMSQPKDLRAVFLMECFKEAKVIDHYGIDETVYELLERIVDRHPASIFMPKTESELESLFH